jgi:hypothetical protein
MTFAEIKEKDPLRYSNLDRIAREKGYLTADQTLADLGNNPELAWLVDWLVMSLEGGAGGLTPGQMRAADNIAAYAKRHRDEAGGNGVGRAARPAAHRTAKEKERDTLAASIAEFAKNIRGNKS